MKQKAIDGSKWGLLEEYRNVFFRSKEEAYPGYVSVLKLDRVKNRLVADYKGQEMVLYDEGYTCVLYLPDDEYWCVSATYDREGKIVEWYFDMILSSCVNEALVPCYDDLYLDLVVAPDFGYRILDEDELLDALHSGEITNEDYALAHDTCDRLIETVIRNEDLMVRFLSSFRNQLDGQKEKIEEFQ